MEERRTRPDGTRASRGSDLVLAYLLSVPILIGAAATYGASPQFAFLAQNFTLIFAAGVLLFLAGAVRGADGSGLVAFGLLAAGLASLFCVFWGFAVVAAGIACLAFLVAAAAAHRSLATIRFARLPQALALVATAALFLRTAGIA